MLIHLFWYQLINVLRIVMKLDNTFLFNNTFMISMIIFKVSNCEIIMNVSTVVPALTHTHITELKIMRLSLFYF